MSPECEQPTGLYTDDENIFDDPDEDFVDPATGSSEPGRPFRLVKYFSFTGFIVILVFTLVLTIFISSQAKTLALSKSEEYAILLSENLNHQVFQQFVVPVVLYYKQKVRFRDPEQYALMDRVVRNTIHSLNVKQVNLWDLEGTLLYSTSSNGVGEAKTENKEFKAALEGKRSSVLISTPGEGLGGIGRKWTLKTHIPFRAERFTQGTIDRVLGVFEIHQDLTYDYAEITRFQWVSIAISLGFVAVLFVILRQILVRGEKIIEGRNEERRRLEEKLHHSERLANLGQMVAAVSHEIRNPLGIISSTGEILQGKFKTSDTDSRLAEVIVEESRRLNGIVTEFLDFARPEIPRLKSCRLEDVIEDNLAFLAPALEKEEIEIVRDYREINDIEADPDLLYRAFLNIFLNAVQAMPEGGLLTVSTRLPYGSDGNGTGMVEAIVADTGEGIDETLAKQIFTPFFTTKNRGSGLGLAIVKNIIDNHNGEIAIEPNDDGGTKIIIRLPIRRG